MKILGVSEIDNDAGAALFVDGQLVAAANEERFSRIKMHAGFPYRAVDWMLRTAKLQTRDLDLVIIVKAEPAAEKTAVTAPLRAYNWWGIKGPLSRRMLNWLVFHGYRMPRNRLEIGRLGRQIDSWLQDSGIPRHRIVRAHHHRAHAAAAFFASGFDQALAVTCDGQGEGVTASVYRCAGSTLDLLHEVKTPNSMGFFYAMVTRALGFRPARHEGKVTGLAAYESPDPTALALFRELAYPVQGAFETPGVYGALFDVKRLAQSRGRASIAAAAQAVLEEVVVSYVSHYVRTTGQANLALAGGVFANVKLNQRAFEIPGVERIFVFPHMGDGGLGYGGIVDALAETDGRKGQAISDVYWGPQYTDAEMEAALIKAGLAYELVPDLERRLGEMLAGGKIVARFAGRMEFGPRALGNRSILYAATDRTVNDWLNKRLRRTEFMPFAPAVLAERGPDLFQCYRGAQDPAQFMTITFNCTSMMRDMCPAVVHIDGTARPQIIHHEVNPPYYAIIDEYRQRTGLPAIINTSFNMHEEPIVMSPDDAIRAFLASGLDVLAMGPYLSNRER